MIRFLGSSDVVPPGQTASRLGLGVVVVIGVMSTAHHHSHMLDPEAGPCPAYPRRGEKMSTYPCQGEGGTRGW